MPAKRLITTALLLTSAVTASAEPMADDKAPKRLLELRSEIANMRIEKVMANLPRYRPLCDAEGYPLVGNVATKADTLQPSEVCRAVRAKQAK